MKKFRLGRWSARRTAVPLIAFFLQVAVSVVPAFSEAPSMPPEEIISSTPQQIQNGLTGMPIPPFTANTLSGRPVSTSDRDFKALIIEFWGLNCASCLEEMVALEPLHKEFGDRGLRIWSVNAEGIGPEKILAGLEKKGVKVSHDLIVDPDLAVTHLFTRWFIPVTVIVDRDGVVQYYKVGFNHKELELIRRKVAELVAP